MQTVCPLGTVLLTGKTIGLILPVRKILSTKTTLNLTPEELYQLLVETGIEPEQVRKLLVWQCNENDAVSGIYASPKETGIGPVITLFHEDSPEDRVTTVLHEATHFKDNLNHPWLVALSSQRVSVAMALGVSASILYEIGAYKYGPKRKSKKSLDRYWLDGLARASAISREIENITYAIDPMESRAFAAENNQELVDKYKDTLYLHPE